MEKIELSRSRRIDHKKRSKLDRVYDKKPLIELVVAVLSIPSLILVVLLNFNTLKSLNTTKISPTPGPINTVQPLNTNNTKPNFFTEPVTRQQQPTLASSATQAPCNKSLGPVSITSPNEGDTINSNPVEVDISYDNTDYCSAVWSYSINGSNWSDYDNNSVALYNLPDGPIKFQLKVKSLTSSDSTTLTRNFMYTGQSTASVPTASGSAH